MAKKKNKNDILNSSTYTSRTVTRSGVIQDGRELVVVCGYSVGGVFGYFVCWEQQTQAKGNKILYEYSNPITFKKKENERTLHEVLADFRLIVAKTSSQ